MRKSSTEDSKQELILRQRAYAIEQFNRATNPKGLILTIRNQLLEREWRLVFKEAGKIDLLNQSRSLVSHILHNGENDNNNLSATCARAIENDPQSILLEDENGDDALTFAIKKVEEYGKGEFCDTAVILIKKLKEWNPDFDIRRKYIPRNKKDNFNIQILIEALEDQLIIAPTSKEERLVGLIESDEKFVMKERALRDIAEKSPDFSSPYDDGEKKRTPLMRAIDLDKEEEAKWLLGKPVNLNVTDEKKQTALMLAVSKGQAAIAEKIVKTGRATLGLQDNAGETALMKSAEQKGNISEVLIEVSKDDIVVLNQEDAKGETALRKFVRAENKAASVRMIETQKVIADCPLLRTTLRKSQFEVAEAMLGSHGIKVSVEKIRKNIDPMKVSPTGSYISMLKEATGFGLPADKKNKEEVKDKAKNDKIIKNLEAVNDVFVESKKSRFSFEKDSADSKKTEKKEISSKDIGKINKILSKDGERSTKRTLRTLLRKPESDEYRGAFDNIAPDEKSPLISRVLAKASASPEAVGELLKTIALTPAKSLFIKDSGGRYPLEIAQDRESKDRAFAPIVKAITQKRKQLVLTEDAFETRDDMKQGIPATLSTDVEPVSVNVHNIPKSTTVLGQTSPLSTGRSTGLGSVNK